MAVERDPSPALQRYVGFSLLRQADLVTGNTAQWSLHALDRVLVWTAHACNVGRPGSYWRGRRRGSKGAGRRPSIQRYLDTRHNEILVIGARWRKSVKRTNIGTD